MINLRFVIVCLGVLAAAAGPWGGHGRAAVAGPAQPLLLRASVMVEDPVIRLDDLFDGALADGAVAVARAPAPGNSLVLDATWLAGVAHAYGLPWQPASRFDQVVVGRRSQEVGEHQIKGVLLAALAERGLGGDIDLEFDAGNPTLTLPTNVSATVAIQQLSVDSRTRRFTATIVAPGDGPVEARTILYGAAFAMTDVPVVTRRVMPGEVIASADIGWASVRVDRIGSNALLDPAQLVGKTPRHPIRPNEPLRSGDLQTAVAIKKGSQVTVIYATENMMLTVLGRAMEDGAEGGVVRVMNTKSNRVIEATVVDARTVRVAGAGL